MAGLGNVREPGGTGGKVRMDRNLGREGEGGQESGEGRGGWAEIWSCMWYEQAPRGKSLLWSPDAHSGLLGSLQMVPCDLNDRGIRSSDLPRQFGTASPLRKTSHVR